MKILYSKIIIAGISLLVLATGTRVDAQIYDELYMSSEQIKKERKEAKERKEEYQKQRLEYLAQLEIEEQKRIDDEQYYNDPIDEKGFTESDIDAYNRRGKFSGKERESFSKKERKTERPPKKRYKRGEYASRIQRFHNDNAIVVKRGNNIYILQDDNYNDYDYYDPYYGDGPTYVYFIENGYNYYDPWYYGTWPGSWYGYPYCSYWDPWWHWPPYYGFSWGWHFGWRHWRFGWGGYGYGYHNGYYDGYYNGYYDGYYGGYYGGYPGSYSYDPYAGRTYKNYNQGRRSSQTMSGRKGVERNIYNRESQNTIRNNNRGRENYARGTYWNSSEYRHWQNKRISSEENKQVQRDPSGRHLRGVFDHSNVSTSKIDQSAIRDNRTSQKTLDASVYRSPKSIREEAIRSGNIQRGVFLDGQKRERNVNRQKEERAYQVDPNIYRQNNKMQRIKIERSSEKQRDYTPRRSSNSNQNTWSSQSNNSSRGSWSSGSSSSSNRGSVNRGGRR